LRVLKKRRDYIETQIHEVVQVSPIEKKHPNNPHGMSGGWKWIDIPYEEQLKIKQNQVKEAFFHIQKLMTPSPLGEGWGEVFEDIQSSPLVDGYRNKVEFSFGKYISHRYEKEEHFNV
jgi:tRNA/tmRNA/rRNA uracil-C5-methylase (TrmA/RlmC/RlmD family)